jgi:hypothetical protein
MRKHYSEAAARGSSARQQREAAARGSRIWSNDDAGLQDLHSRFAYSTSNDGLQVTEQKGPTSFKHLHKGLVALAISRSMAQLVAVTPILQSVSRLLRTTG